MNKPIGEVDASPPVKLFHELRDSPIKQQIKKIGAFDTYKRLELKIKEIQNEDSMDQIDQIDEEKPSALTHERQTPGSKRNIFTKKGPSPFIFFEQQDNHFEIPKATPKFKKDLKLPWERGGSLVLV